LLILTAVALTIISCASTPEKVEGEPEEVVADEPQVIMEGEDIAQEEAVAEASAVSEAVAPEGAVSAAPKGVADKTVETAIPLGTAPQSEAVRSAHKFNHKILLLASEITANLKEYDPELEAVVVTSMVDLDVFESTNQFGRYVTERLIYEMHRSGYRVYEMRQSKSIDFVSKRGEFQLTREGKELLNRFRSDAVIVGTYSFVNGILSLHTRMVEYETSRVISVASLEFDIIEDLYTKSLYEITDQRKGVEMSFAPVRGDM
jgi:TolB-like protein